MAGLIGFAMRHRNGIAALMIGLAAGFMSFCLGLRLDQGSKRYLIKRLTEALRMPGRLST